MSNQIDMNAVAQARDTIEGLSRAWGEPPRAVVDRLLGPTPNGRAGAWRVRLRVVANGAVVADTDDDLAPSAPGVDVVHSLSAIAAWATGILSAFHGPRLDEQATRHAFSSRVPSLRVALGRGGGRATWSVPYVAGPYAYVARVDVARAATSRAVMLRRGIY